MNGRVYDPSIGRFLSPDIQVPYIEHTQSFNRYSYVQNNPLSRVDPTGYGDKTAAERQREEENKTCADNPNCSLTKGDIGSSNNSNNDKTVDASKKDAGDSGNGAQNSKDTKNNYTVNDGVVINESAEEKVGKIADKYNKLTNEQLTVTSSTRSASTQAKAMYNKMKAGADVDSLYKNKKALKEIKKSYDDGVKNKDSESKIIESMKKVIQGQVDKKIYISKHMKPGAAADIRSRNMNKEQKKAFRKSAKGVAKKVILEEKPPHWHLSFE